MRTAGTLATVLAFAIAAARVQGGTAAPGAPGDAGPDKWNIFRIPFVHEQKTPFTVTCSPFDSVLIQLPYPATGWSGRGFMPEGKGGDDSRVPVAADFSIYPGNVIGYRQITVTALVDKSARTLHIFMEGGRVLTLECAITMDRELAFRGVSFVDEQAGAKRVEQAIRVERERAVAVERAEDAPVSRYQEPNPQMQTGLVRFMRAIAGMEAERAESMIKANPAIQFVRFNEAAVRTDFGAFEVIQRFAVRDAVTDMLGLMVVVRSKSIMRLEFDPAGWILRAGDRVYPFNTADFAGTVEPGATVPAFLVLARDQQGGHTRLMPDSPFQVSARLLKSVNPKPLIMEPVNVR
jgi:hypothetical protein